MICNGGARANGAQLVDYLMHSLKNDQVSVVELSREKSLAAEIAHMEADAAGGRARKPLYHAQVRSRDDEHLTPEQIKRAVEVYTEKMGFEGLARAVVVHRFKGHDHIHIVYGRIDPETGKARDYKNDYAKQELAGRTMEAEFGLARTQGRFYDENGQAYANDNQRRRSRSRTNKAEQGQEQRSGYDTNARKDHLTGIWLRTRQMPSVEFLKALSAAGYTLTRGDRRDFVVIDKAGEVHSLARQLRGIRAVDVRARLADLNPSSIPTVRQVRTEIRRARHDVEQPRLPAGLPEPRQREPSRRIPEAAFRPQQQPTSKQDRGRPRLEARPDDGRYPAHVVDKARAAALSAAVGSPKRAALTEEYNRIAGHRDEAKAAKILSDGHSLAPMPNKLSSQKVQHGLTGGGVNTTIADIEAMLRAGRTAYSETRLEELRAALDSAKDSSARTARERHEIEQLRNDKLRNGHKL